MGSNKLRIEKKGSKREEACWAASINLTRYFSSLSQRICKMVPVNDRKERRGRATLNVFGTRAIFGRVTNFAGAQKRCVRAL